MLKRLRELFHRNDVDREIRDELQFHIDEQTAANVASGMSPDQARAAAIRDFGSVAAAEEQCHDAHGYPFLATVADDVRFGLRLARKSKPFAATIIATLAVAIAANTAMFSIVYGVLLKPIDLRDSDRVYALFETSEGERNAVSPANFLDWRAQSRSFSAMAAYSIDSLNLGGAASKRILATSATEDFIAATGVGPGTGRGFAPADFVAGAPPVALIAEHVAEQQFGRTDAALGKTLLIDGVSTTVIGVMPHGYAFPRQTEVWMPLTFGPNAAKQRGAHYLRVVARLAPNASAGAASRELSAIAAQLAKLYPRWNEGAGAAMMQLQTLMVESSRKGLLLLLASVVLLAVIACVNVGNLLLGRAGARVHEASLRTALGATRGRLIRQYLTEASVFSLLGGAAGALLAWAALRLIVRFGPRNIPRLDLVTLDVRSLAFTAAMTIAATIVFGIAPALRLSRGLSAGTRVIGRRGAARARTILACSELALAVTLATGAALLVRSFASVAAVDPGFDSRNVIAFDVALPAATYPDTQHINQYYDRMLQRLATIPGVRETGAVAPFPLNGDGYSSSLTINAGEELKDSADVRLADAGYFRALHIPVIRGSAFDGREDLSTERVLLVSREAARRFWPNGADPIGSTVRLGARLGYEKIEGRVIGVVGDVRDAGRESDIAPIIYVPFRQSGVPIISFFVRSAVAPPAIVETIRGEAASVDRAVAIADPKPVEALLADSVSRRRFQTILLGAFAATALLLACIGVYGVLAESVMQRYREIGIRLALGAQPWTVFARLMTSASAIIAVAVTLGLIGAVAFRRAIASLLFGVTATDPATLAAVAASVAVVSVVAAAVPALRAMRVDPVAVLRQE